MDNVFPMIAHLRKKYIRNMWMSFRIEFRRNPNFWIASDDTNWYCQVFGDC